MHSTDVPHNDMVLGTFTVDSRDIGRWIASPPYGLDIMLNY